MSIKIVLKCVKISAKIYFYDRLVAMGDMCWPGLGSLLFLMNCCNPMFHFGPKNIAYEENKPIKTTFSEN